MKAQEIRQLTVEELNAKLKELKSELFNLRFQHAVTGVQTCALPIFRRTHKEGQS